MREILFRGKRIDNGNMVFGDLSQHKTGKVFIKCGSATQSFEVDPDTVGQFTGLTDKNGKKIFEGDIVTIPGSKMMGLPAPVAYFPKGAVFQIRRNGYNAITLWDADETMEVIGNIHDNPELLEGARYG